MWKYNYTNELYHHGIVGMKWGVRRYQNKDGSLTSTGKKRRSIGQVYTDHKKKKQQKERLEKARATREANKKAAAEREELIRTGDAKKILKNKSKFTNEELQRAVDRLDLERKISDASTRQVKAGEKFVKGVVEQSGRNIATQLTTYAMGAAVNKILKDNIVNPKKGQKDK